MIDWILSHLVQVITVVFVIVSIIKGMRQSGRRNAEERPVAIPDDSEEQRRVREIQETIRRKIAERRGEHGPQTVEPPPRRDVPPPLAPSPPIFPTLPPPLQGEPARRVLVERAPVQSRAEPPRLPQSNRAELERQFRLADELRVAEDTRLQLARRAAHQATEKSEAAQAHGALLTASRERLLFELGDRHSLRRAMVLREVLGPPVALR